MKAGTLRHRVDIQRRTVERNTYGDPVQTWVTVDGGSRRAAFIRPLNSREIDRARQVESETTHEVTIRALSGVNSTYRLQYGSRYLQVESVIDVEERGVEMILRCVESSDTDED